MEEKNNSVWFQAMNYGALLGISLVIYMVLLYLTNLQLNKPLSYVTFVLLLAGIIYGIINYRDKILGGYISYGKALGFGTLTALFAAIITAFFSYIQYKIIDPSSIDKLLSIAEEQLMNKGMSQDQVDMAIQIQSKMFTPFFLAISQVFTLTFIGFAFSLISAGFLKKESNPFSNQSFTDNKSNNQDSLNA
jgi:hypothetical protein